MHQRAKALHWTNTNGDHRFSLLNVNCAIDVESFFQSTNEQLGSKAKQWVAIRKPRPCLNPSRVLSWTGGGTMCVFFCVYVYLYMCLYVLYNTYKHIYKYTKKYTNKTHATNPKVQTRAQGGQNRKKYAKERAVRSSPILKGTTLTPLR